MKGCFVSAVLFLGVPTCIVAGEKKSTRELSLAGLGSHVTWLASRLDCYFTVEEGRVTDLSEAAQAMHLSGRSMEIRTAMNSVDELVHELKKHYPDAVVFRNPTNTAVIHIVHKAYYKHKDYYLNEKLSLAFDGTPSGMIWTMEKKGSRLQTRPSTLHDFLYFDPISKIRVRAEKQVVRDVLTDYLPLSEYRRVLWVARSDKQVKNCDVRYEGRYRYFAHNHRRDFPEHADVTVHNPNPFCDFTNGEGAYYANVFNDKTQQAAIDWIVNEMKKKEPRQVRWAMFFLGKHQCQDAAPLLLKHLDYRYTQCGVIEESYPAVKGLTGLGKTITPLLLALLENEKNDLRIRLAVQVLFNLHQANATQTLLKKSRDAAQNRDQQRRFELALNALREFEK